jgi:hypothetical protein
MLNTSATHIAELEESIKEVVGLLLCHPFKWDGYLPHDYERYGNRLKDAAESFGLKIKKEDE